MDKICTFFIVAVTIVLCFTGCNETEPEVLVPDEPLSSEEDRQVLIRIFEDNPDNTLYRDTTRTDLRDWRGVAVNDEGHVFALRLEDIGGLEHLVELDVEKNGLLSLPTEVSKLSKLEQLIAGHNHFPSFPFEVSSFPS